MSKRKPWRRTSLQDGGIVMMSEEGLPTTISCKTTDAYKLTYNDMKWIKEFMTTEMNKITDSKFNWRRVGVAAKDFGHEAYLDPSHDARMDKSHAGFQGMVDFDLTRIESLEIFKTQEECETWILAASARWKRGSETETASQ